MRIRPRQQILDVWQALVSSSWSDGRWNWGDPAAANSISDSERLLCLLYPATEIKNFSLDRPDEMADDVYSVLQPLGGQTRIGVVVLGLLEEYVTRNSKQDGSPCFSTGRLSGDGEREPTAEQRDLEVVMSYSMSTTLCLAGLGFLRVFETWVRNEGRTDLGGRVEVLRSLLSKRLTAAMIGLIRSFVVRTASPKSEAGRNMLRMLNQSGLPERIVVRNVAKELERIRGRLRSDVSLGQTPDTELEDDSLLFECGWSWGIAERATEVVFEKDKPLAEYPIAQQKGFAEDRPSLYFTMIALDGINDLISQRTRELDLLDDEQYRLAEALRVRWDLTQGYWSTVARFGDSGWPLEDIPWRTSDGEESDYLTLTVSAVLIQDLINRTATDDDLTRAIDIFDELARRGRVVRRPTLDDPAVTLHTTGVRLALRGTEKVGDGPLLYWRVSDFAPVLLKRILQAVQLSDNIDSRDRLMSLAKSVMDHLDARKLREGNAAGLWDDPFGVFDPGREAVKEPSWYMTERVIESFVAADRTFRKSPLASPAMIIRAVELLNEAEHLLDQAMLNVSLEDDSLHRATLEQVEDRLEQARQFVAGRQAGTAFVLASDSLRELHKLKFARGDAGRSSYT